MLARRESSETQLELASLSAAFRFGYRSWGLNMKRSEEIGEQLSNVVFWLIESGGVFLLNDSVIEGPSFDDERYFFVAVEPSPFL